MHAPNMVLHTRSPGELSTTVFTGGTPSPRCNARLIILFSELLLPTSNHRLLQLLFGLLPTSDLLLQLLNTITNLWYKNPPGSNIFSRNNSDP